MARQRWHGAAGAVTVVVAVAFAALLALAPHAGDESRGTVYAQEAPTASASPTATGTATSTHTVTATPSRTATSTASPTATASSTVSPTATTAPAGTVTPAATASPTSTGTAPASATPTASVTPTPSPTATSTTTATTTPTATSTATATLSPTSTPTATTGPAVPSNHFAGANLLSIPGTVSGNNSAATTEPGEPTVCFQDDFNVTIGKTVWFKLAPASSGVLTITTEQSNFDTVVALYTGSSLGSLAQIGCNDDDLMQVSGSNPPEYILVLTSFLQVDVTAGQTYYLQLGGTFGASGNFVLEVSLGSSRRVFVPTPTRTLTPTPSITTTPSITPTLGTTPTPTRTATPIPINVVALATLTTGQAAGTSSTTLSTTLARVAAPQANAVAVVLTGAPRAAAPGSPGATPRAAATLLLAPGVQAAMYAEPPPGVSLLLVMEALEPAAAFAGGRALPVPPEVAQVRRALRVQFFDSVTGAPVTRHARPVTIAVDCTAQDRALAGGEVSRLRLARYDDALRRFLLLPTYVAYVEAPPFGAAVAQAQPTCTLFGQTSQTSDFALLALTGMPVALDHSLPADPERGTTGGHFFTQASGLHGLGGAGYAIVDDTAARLWSEFQRLGGVARLGYPAGRRTMQDGFLVQVTQRGVLQWRPELGQVQLTNVFDQLHDAGADAYLLAYRQIPPPQDTAPLAGCARDFHGCVVPRHLALLDPQAPRNLNGTPLVGIDPTALAALHAFYFAEPEWLTRFGLPTGIAQFGNSVVVRAQRVALQYWLVDVPWAPQGSITLVNGGDLSKEAGLWDAESVQPELPPLVAPPALPVVSPTAVTTGQDGTR